MSVANGPLVVFTYGMYRYSKILAATVAYERLPAIVETLLADKPMDGQTDGQRSYSIDCYVSYNNMLE